MNRKSRIYLIKDLGVIPNPAIAEFVQSFSHCISEMATSSHLMFFQALTITFQPEISAPRCKWQVVELRQELSRRLCALSSRQKTPGCTSLQHESLSLAAVWPPHWCSRMGLQTHVKQGTNRTAHYKHGLPLAPAAVLCRAPVPGLERFSQPSALSPHHHTVPTGYNNPVCPNTGHPKVPLWPLSHTPALH